MGMVKVKVKVKFTLEQTTKAKGSSRGIAVLLTSALDVGGWSTPRPGRFTPGKDPVFIVQEAGWASGPVWTGVENLAHTGIRSPDRPARSQMSLLLPFNPTNAKINPMCYLLALLRAHHILHVSRVGVKRRR